MSGLGFSRARIIVGSKSVAGFRGSTGTRATDRLLGWAARSTHTDRDSCSDRRVVQRVRALHHGTALARITQTERGGRARHLEYIIQERHIIKGFTYLKKEG